MNKINTDSGYGEDNMYFQCCTSTDECIHSRRCFMTGEYCSKQNSIQKERNTLYKNEKPLDDLKSNKDNVAAITAFVIMNFSDMSDVMYKWRIRRYSGTGTVNSMQEVDKTGQAHHPKITIDPCDTEGMKLLMDNYGDSTTMFPGKNENGEMVLVSIFHDRIVMGTYQDNGWKRQNIYYRDGTSEELFVGREML